MLLVLMRHGEAEPLSTSDETRVLTERGRRQSVETATYIKEMGLKPFMVSSPYVRARQTAEIVSAILGIEEAITECQQAIPDGSVTGTLQQLEEFDKDVIVLVSHMPFVSQLAGWLVDGVRSDAYPMSVGSVMMLDSDLWLPGLAKVRGQYFPVAR